MQKFIRSLPPRLEFWIVAVLAFGLFVYASVAHALHPQAPAQYSSARLLFLPAMEIILIVGLGFFLRARGWTLRRMGLTFEPADIGIAVLLFFAAYTAWAVVFYLALLVAPDIAQGMSDKAPSLIARDIPFWIIALASLINPVFEEVFETGYVIGALKREGNIWFAINVSVGIRLLCHLYQGPLGVLSSIPIGLIFAYWYARSGRLWPLIIAHAGMDLLALVAYSRM
jgi:membrane protease YdiL (CAAX protease family)